MRYMLVLLLLTGCQDNRNFSVTHPYALETTPPSGSPVFRQAYTDGCETALSGMGSQFIKMFHNFQYDASKAQDPLYVRVWEASNNYCRLFLFVGDEQLNSEDFKRYNKPVWIW